MYTEPGVPDTLAVAGAAAVSADDENETPAVVFEKLEPPLPPKGRYTPQPLPPPQPLVMPGAALPPGAHPAAEDNVPLEYNEPVPLDRNPPAVEMETGFPAQLTAVATPE